MKSLHDTEEIPVINSTFATIMYKIDKEYSTKKKIVLAILATVTTVVLLFVSIFFMFFIYLGAFLF